VGSSSVVLCHSCRDYVLVDGYIFDYRTFLRGIIMKEFFITFAIIVFLSGVTLNVMACPETVECGPEDDLTGC
jgi:hypothetical protein